MKKFLLPTPIKFKEYFYKKYSRYIPIPGGWEYHCPFGINTIIIRKKKDS